MDIKPTICRICIDQNKSLQLLSEVNIECADIILPMLDVLKILFGIEFDCSTYHICPRCIEHATSSYKFKVLWDESNVKYRNYLERFKNQAFLSNTTGTLGIKEEKQSSDDDLPLSYFASANTQSDSDPNIRNEREIVTEKKKNRKTKRFSAEIWNDQLGECKFCKKLFKNKYVLIAHEKRHENKGKFICNECGKGFDSKGCLSRHIKVHTGEKKFECKECHRCFLSSNNLRLHSRRHNGIKPYLCTQCGKSFSHPTGLNYHLRTHTRERPYTCEICGKTFVIKCHLDRHKKIHTGERPFVCKQCDRAFIKKIDLQRHEQIHTGEKPHICQICNKSFLRILHLNYHMMVHTSERPHRCSFCGKGFIRRYNLTSHVKKSHSEDAVRETDISIS
ncbi:oocyte zinc finger protein XlCOF6.1-like [Coccinella septempunctata]|uniref:oocyte zinc finger protein XlCOF6.1-like n=1 Tax=Coccinella septempunctata TaxID=41139 RepID=UPI001D076B35|nr:oocyte zinc finger protein XlCOF6.1-like [Coccinella septempunctata]